jgi:hypothetical protein
VGIAEIADIARHPTPAREKAPAPGTPVISEDRKEKTYHGGAKNPQRTSPPRAAVPHENFTAEGGGATRVSSVAPLMASGETAKS